jgi:hypothetical protein
VTPHRAICGQCPLSLPGSGPADVLSGNIPEALAQLGLLEIDNLAPMALGAKVLHRHPAHKAFRSPVKLLQNRNGPAARASIFPFQLSQPSVFLGMRHLDDSADLDDGLALGDQLLGGPLLRRSLRLELADDLLRSVPGGFHGRVPGPVRPDEDSHSPWTDKGGPRQTENDQANPTQCLLAPSGEVASLHAPPVQKPQPSLLPPQAPTNRWLRNVNPTLFALIMQ